MEKHEDINRHQPVMPAAAVAGLLGGGDNTDQQQGGRVFVDATFGAGGHSHRILAQLPPDDLLIALDCDAVAAVLAQKVRADNFRFIRANFADLAAVLQAINISQINGILFDLGVSSMQLDDGARGFSFRNEAVLDMRMDQNLPQTAQDWIQNSSEKSLFFALKNYGEEPEARRIARAMYADKHQLKTTGHLADLVKSVKRQPTAHRHPATLVFQAIRMAVNDELNNIRTGLAAAVRLLKTNGRLVVIAFNSLEDRIAKQLGMATALPGFGRLYPNQIKPLGRMQKPDADEVGRNPRARSACLRVFCKLEAAA